MRKGFLVLSLVAFTVLASAGAAQAQRYGYAGGWGGGYYYPQARYYNSYYGGPGYYPQTRYYGSYYGGRAFSPYYEAYYQSYGNGYSPGYYYTTPSYAISPASYDLQPATNTPTMRAVQSVYSGAEGDSRFATVTVVVPTANAQVWFGDTPTTQQGTERSFHSPELVPGKNFTYTIKARWIENGKTVESDRKVKVRAGQSTTVTFRDSPSETAPAPDAAQPN
ncbi:hypothetical protein AYO40_06065 [Planctomycetaceae bacterium SCGC AG-212-D15]|nr:hypothetical protein AYO40_06065 [Planctomycetaceae bacterium SCGC AG-212-D15]